MENTITFHVVDSLPSTRLPLHAYLINDKWDDWGKYATQYYLVLYDEKLNLHEIGHVKIAEAGLEASPTRGAGKRRATLPEEFVALDDKFFSLGTTIQYYENMEELPYKQELLVALRDCAYMRSIYERYREEYVMGESLLRNISSRLYSKFFTIATGCAEPLPFNCTYHFPHSELEMEIKVDPDSVPPTNIYAIIGSNGVGKTRLLTHIYKAACLIHPENHEDEYGKLDFRNDDEHFRFSKVVVISLNSFDTLQDITVNEDELATPVCIYTSNTYHEYKTNTPTDEKLDLSTSLFERIKSCRHKAKKKRMFTTLSNLEGDPIFRDAGIKDLLEVPEKDLKKEVRRIYNSLSSGHRVVLLAAVHLVDSVDDETLVLIDEPESHLHPPLLSAFIRALSELLKTRNAVAIVATHSPIVLQEVPSKCVYQLVRSGDEINIFHPEIETFGENVQTLTKEIFRLEVMATGFYRFISDIVRQHPDTSYEAIIKDIFQNRLGSEGKAVLLTKVYNTRKSHEKN